MKTYTLSTMLALWSCSSGALAQVVEQQPTFYRSAIQVDLNISQTDHLFGSALLLLSTCVRMDTLVGRPTESAALESEFTRLKQGNYLLIRFRADDRVRLPIANDAQDVDELYVGYRDDGMPDVVTVSHGRVQDYGKCSGSVVVHEFLCDAQLAQLLAFRPNESLCRSAAENQRR
jgi:hypothetical protein